MDQVSGRKCGRTDPRGQAGELRTQLGVEPGHVAAARALCLAPGEASLPLVGGSASASRCSSAMVEDWSAATRSMLPLCTGKVPSPIVPTGFSCTALQSWCSAEARGTGRCQVLVGGVSEAQGDPKGEAFAVSGRGQRRISL
jgi:hypothetical protein